MLKIKSIQFQVGRNPDVKCSIVERAQRTIRDMVYTFFTYSNTRRYIDALQKFVNAYNDTVHTTTGMTTSKVTDSDFLAIWQKMNKMIRRVRIIRARFKVGQHVRISMEIMIFEKGAKENFSRKYFELIRLLKEHPGLSTSWNI